MTGWSPPDVPRPIEEPFAIDGLTIRVARRHDAVRNTPWWDVAVTEGGGRFGTYGYDGFAPETPLRHFAWLAATARREREARSAARP